MNKRIRALGRPARRGRQALELSVIFIAAILLVISVIGLAGRTITAGKTDPYPNLRIEMGGAVSALASKTVYFTFDDGPSKNTEKILDMLKEENVKATFFVSVQIEDTEFIAKMLRRMVDEGHAIGLHSYTHEMRKIYKSADAYLADINKLNDFIVENAGYKPEIIRFPGGSHTVNASKSVMKELAAALSDRGYPYFDWHVASGDDNSSVYSVEYLARRMLDGMKGLDTAVILCHDNATPKTTSEAVRAVITQLREQGYSFDRLEAGLEPIHIK